MNTEHYPPFPYIKAALVIVGLVTLYFAVDILLILFASVLGAIFICRSADFLRQRTPLGPKPSVGVVVAVLMFSAGLFVWMVGPELSDQVSQLSKGLPKAAEQAQEKLSDYPTLQEAWLRIEEEVASSKVENPLSQAKTLFSGLVGVMSGLLLLLAGTLYLAFQPQPYVKGFTRTLTKLLGNEEGEKLKDDLQSHLWGFLVGQSQTMLILGAFTTVGLWAIGMPNFFALGIIAGLLAFVPVIGPLLSVVPALVIALSESPEMALYVLLLYAGIQLVESNLITPILQQRNSDLPPVLTLAFQGVLGAVCGPLGVFVAAPIAVVFMVVGGHWLDSEDSPREKQPRTYRRQGATRAKLLKSEY